MPREPASDEEHVTIAERHVTLGVLTRRFPKSGHVGMVYDWVGSISLIPEHFTLSMVGNGNLNPTLPIATVNQAMLSMYECDESPSYPDETVCFLGFGRPYVVVQPDNTSEPVSEKIPSILLEDDDDT